MACSCTSVSGVPRAVSAAGPRASAVSCRSSCTTVPPVPGHALTLGQASERYLFAALVGLLPPSLKMDISYGILLCLYTAPYSSSMQSGGRKHGSTLLTMAAVAM